MYQRILVPIDDSKTSVYALQEACRLAKAVGATLVAVHVVDLSDLKREATMLPRSEELYALEAQVADHAEEIMKQAGVPYEIETLENDGMRVADVLIKEAARQQCDLIAMGTHGFSGLLHLLMGSVAEGVLRQANVPVLLFRRMEDEE
ncbi:universal stress protein [Eikenella sp. S3360]|uniref:Universal stress protein n=1 Tax=Eikenella glucosivorans TaxID=2766967 RepID=A0ABS0N713_9NEIS|nr:universal stress protein [Eikenella glucosivorans]MBH5328070.1 universal stress protein [Eikenella glucosivorans]